MTSVNELIVTIVFKIYKLGKDEWKDVLKFGDCLALLSNKNKREKRARIIVKKKMLKKTVVLTCSSDWLITIKSRCKIPDKCSPLTAGHFI